MAQDVKTNVDEVKIEDVIASADANVEPATDAAAIVEEYEKPVSRKFNDICRSIIANGGRKIANLRVKNVNYTEKDNYIMVSFTLDDAVPAMDGEDKVLNNIIYTSLYAINATLKEKDDTAWMADYFLTHPKALKPIFNGSTITVIQQEVAPDELYVNPFSNSVTEGVAFGHPVIINYVVDIKLGKFGNKAADKLLDTMFMLEID